MLRFLWGRKWDIILILSRVDVTIGTIRLVVPDITLLPSSEVNYLNNQNLRILESSVKGMRF
jgi:hypothetical protein